MIEIDDTLISEEILENDFVCNLDACKGACCVEGDAGAPVEDEEVEILERIYHKVAPYLSEQGRQAIEAQGTAIRGSDGEWETPLINGGECAYVVRDEKGIVLCGIEQAYREGKIDWKSLFPVTSTLSVLSSIPPLLPLITIAGVSVRMLVYWGTSYKYPSISSYAKPLSVSSASSGTNSWKQPKKW